ncbi:hypothetical protein ACFFUT_10390 [Pseudohalocynthiibacter aestuariivivens]|jgi:hypothetical protein|uniref:Uncharacterized protein n=1 Tax=Pseudohalocynthiibacter aestuariivivens TaxID=1591409 RepID=A0ABV5JGG8_9RHOB|nr:MULTISPECIES: hypothetical protein [Pseudohalocynthiibacter]MBS9717770.1 hypothetical protein [Pseudohalocynthiibacter aestuariivivens]MCK0103080.1 hypothetical protein [Pseudohalocynthiibacter sp. F2068]
MNLASQYEPGHAENRFPPSESNLKNVGLFVLRDEHRIAEPAFLFSANALRITCGVCSGEKIESVEDFIAGDTLKLASSANAKPAFLSGSENQIVITMARPVDVGANQFVGNNVHPIALMSENGRALSGSIVADTSTTQGSVFLLLSEEMEPNVEYTILWCGPN